MLKVFPLYSVLYSHIYQVNLVNLMNLKIININKLLQKIFLKNLWCKTNRYVVRVLSSLVLICSFARKINFAVQNPHKTCLSAPFWQMKETLKTKIFDFFSKKMKFWKCNLTLWCIGLILNAFISQIISSKRN